MATAVRPSGNGTRTQVITLNNLVKNWNTMTQNQQANNYIKYKNKLNNKLTQEQKNKVINYINSKRFPGVGRRLNNTPKQRTPTTKIQNEPLSPTGVLNFPLESPTVTPKQSISKTILKQELLNTYLTFTYEMRPGMEKKIFWRYVLLLLYSYNQIYGGLVKNNMNMFVEQYYPKTNTMNGVVSEDQQKKWANVFMKLLNKMDSSESRQIFTRLQKNISNNIK
jgi:hypothetical protein